MFEINTSTWEPNHVELFKLFSNNEIINKEDILKRLNLGEKNWLSRKSKVNRKLRPYGLVIEKITNNHSSPYKLKEFIYDGKGSYLTIDLSISNKDIYAGCLIMDNLLDGPELKSSNSDIIKKLKQNINTIIKKSKLSDNELILTGNAPHWVYLIAYQVTEKHFNKIWYEDLKERTLIKEDC